jgi:hypothetical protein
MPILNIKPEFVAKLKELDCYDKWKVNLISQWEYIRNRSGSCVTLSDLQEAALSDWKRLISHSFHWIRTPERDYFWDKIYHS